MDDEKFIKGNIRLGCIMNKKEIFKVLSIYRGVYKEFIEIIEGEMNNLLRMQWAIYRCFNEKYINGDMMNS